MSQLTAPLSPVADRGMIDLVRSLNAKIKHPWQLKCLPFGWVLVVYFDSGVGDHPLREDGGRDDGKCAIPWYERKHEIAGFGKTPSEAAHGVLTDGKGARLRAQQVVSIEDRKRHLVFKNLDTGQILWPTAQGLLMPKTC